MDVNAITRVSGLTRIVGNQIELDEPAGIPKASILVPRGTIRVQLYAETVDFNVAFEPAIVAVFLYAGQFVDTSPWRYRGSRDAVVVDLTDGRPYTDSGSVLMAGAIHDYLYVGFGFLVDRLNVEVAAPNGDTAALTGEYWNGEKWVALENFVDGTTPTGADNCFGKNGQLTWDISPKWEAERVNPELRESFVSQTPIAYWMRLSWDGTLDDATRLSALWPEFSLGFNDAAFFKAGTFYEMDLDKFFVGGLTAGIDAGGETVKANFLINDRPW